jgi:Ca2+-transporting ATPase
MIQSDETLHPLQIRLSVWKAIIHRNSLNLCFYFSIRWLSGEEVLSMLLTSVSLAVAAIPEALPAIVTIALPWPSANKN